MHLLRFALLLSVAVVFSVGCEQPGAKSISVANRGPYPVEIELMVPNPHSQVCLESQDSRAFCPALPLRLANAAICLGARGDLEVSNDGPEPVYVSYVDNAGEPQTLMLDQDHVGYFDGIPAITIGATEFEVGG